MIQIPKRIINAEGTDPNCILPLRYSWARRHYKTGIANNWTPEEVPMQQDIELWKSPRGLSEGERHLILRNLGFFSTAESLTANNLVLAVYRHVTNPECRQYLLRQAYEEAIHTDTFIYCCDTLGLDPEEVYGMYRRIPSIQAKDDFVVDMTRALVDPNFDTGSVEDIQRFVHDLVGFYVIMEGIFFYAGFAMMLSFLRRNRMVGLGEQFQFILRDESVHLAFGADLIRTIADENPDVWTPELQEEIRDNVRRGVDLEASYAQDCLPSAVLGLNAELMREYIEYVANRRLERLDLEPIYAASNPFPWMSEVIDLRKEKNFFETRVTEYRAGGELQWD